MEAFLAMPEKKYATLIVGWPLCAARLTVGREPLPGVTWPPNVWRLPSVIQTPSTKAVLIGSVVSGGSGDVGEREDGEDSAFSMALMPSSQHFGCVEGGGLAEGGVMERDGFWRRASSPSA